MGIRTLNPRTQARSLAFALVALSVALWLAPAARTQSQRQLTVYAPAAVYSVPTISVEGQDYIGLADLLEPLGSVEAHADGKKWKLRFAPSGGHDLNAEFQEGKDKGKVHGFEVKLSGNFHMENGRGYVPYRDVGKVLPYFISVKADFRDASGRLFLGDVTVRFSAELQKNTTPAKMVIYFTAPVNPTIATEPGKVRMVFRRDALINTGPESVPTGDPTITSANFSDAGGTAQLTVNGTVPMIATFGAGNKSIVITPAPGAVATAEAPKPAPAAPTVQEANPAAPIPAIPAPGPSVPAGPRFVIVIDPAHGGDERGAAITTAIAEKDLNLTFARRLQHELQSKGITATLLRGNDATISLDDRAMAANAAHPALYIGVHSANLGTGLRIFTALMSPSGATTHSFLPWSQAQAPYLDLSSQFAGSISAECNNRQIPVTALPAPLRPMRNIAAPAIAIELAPPDDEVEHIANADYQQNIVAAIANGIAAMRPKLRGAK